MMENEKSDIIGNILKQIPFISEVECYSEDEYHDNQFFIETGDGPDGGECDNDIIGILYRMAANIYGTTFYVYLFDGKIRAFLSYSDDNYSEVKEYVRDIVYRFKVYVMIS